MSDTKAESESLSSSESSSEPESSDAPSSSGVSTGTTSDTAAKFLIEPKAALPREIGPYHIVRMIASGGMGTVYEATQAKPRRKVALKVMKHGITSGGALRRFEFEAQILARLHHPGIAQIYDAGQYDDGSGVVPYFAMEYLPNARTITEYVQHEKLSISDRLKLFAHVCEAVSHGHQKGIIHRDLKPGNILVDSSGRPKVIDFGVARATDSDMAVTTHQTDVGQLLGTLQYMSPEQCDADPDDLDIRSDVYSLGVVLYELLCDCPPYDIARKAIFEATRTIREQSPARPSSINRLLRGDVETIALKSLEKDRKRRYQSAGDLAADIRRYLDRTPIEAHPQSLLYQLQMFARRRRGLFVSLSAVLGVLVIALIVISVLYARVESINADLERSNLKLDRERQLAEDERQRAVDAEQRAAEEAERHKQTAQARDAAAAELEGIQLEEIKLMSQLVEVNRKFYVEGADAGRKEMTEVAVPTLVSLVENIPAREAYQAGLAQLLLDVGDMLGGRGEANLGDIGEAEQKFQAAMRIVESMPDTPRTEALVINSMRRLGGLKKTVGDVDAAIGYFTAIKDLCAKRFDEEHSSENRRQYAISLLQLGDMHHQRGDDRYAADLYGLAVDHRSQLYSDAVSQHGATYADTLKAARYLATGYDRIAVVRALLGDLDDAVDYYRRALDLREQVLQHVDSPRMRRDVQKSYRFVAEAELYRGKADSAYAEIQRALPIALNTFESDIDNAEARADIVHTRLIYARVMLAMSEHEQAREQFLSCIETAQEYLPDHAQDHTMRFLCAEAHYGLGLAHASEGDPIESRVALQAAQEQLDQLIKDNPNDVRPGRVRLEVMRELSEALMAADDPGGALGIAEQAVGEVQEAPITLLLTLARAHRASGNMEQAAEIAIEALKRLQEDDGNANTEESKEAFELLLRELRGASDSAQENR